MRVADLATDRAKECRGPDVATSPIPALVLEDLRFGWPGPGAFQLAVPEFRVMPGETVLLVGESGSGKSTLLSLVCGIMTAAAGRVIVAGTDLGRLGAGQRDPFRAERIGVIFQQLNLLPQARVIDNILLPLHFAPGRRARIARPEAEAARLCRALGLPEDVLGRRAARLSIGQQQRVAAARALIGRPELIVADEPTSALDAANRASFVALLLAQSAEAGSAILMVSHDERLGEHFDRVVALDEIAAAGAPPC